MLKKIYRLSGKKNFDKLYRRGNKVFAGPLQIRAINNLENLPRVGVVVPLSFSKKATQRNRVRRKIYQVFQKLIREKRLVKNQDILVSLKAASDKDVETEIIELLKKLGCLNI